MSDDSARDVARRLGMTGQQLHKQLRRMIDRLLDRHHLAAKLFLGTDGKVTPHAREWLQRLADDNFVNRSAFHSDDREHAKREGRRELALEIIGSVRLDTAKLASLTSLEREVI